MGRVGQDIEEDIRRDWENLGDDFYENFVQPFDEGLGEVTGRNLRREQMNKAEERLRLEEQERERLREAELTRRMRQDIQASQRAQSLRSQPTTSGSRTSSSNSPIRPDGDLLGL